MKLRELAVLAASGCGASVCESCGEEFTCGASASGCWCSEVKLDDAARAGLRSRFQRCLCRACLESYAARGEEAPGAGRAQSPSG